MKKVVLGMSVAALLAGAGLATAQTVEPPSEMPATESATPSDNTRVAAADLSAATFKKLDADSDGRVSAIEAANDTAVATGFTKADADKDGYLSKDEFKKLSSSEASSPKSSTEEESTMEPSTTEPSTDTPTTPPQQ